ncbi:MAG: hypothetical protein NVS3B25_18900 [Hymenobacter sp.]
MERLNDSGFIDAALDKCSVRREAGTWLDAINRYEARLNAPAPTDRPHNRLLALWSLRADVEQECAKRLASIDQMIEAETHT